MIDPQTDEVPGEGGTSSFGFLGRLIGLDRFERRILSVLETLMARLDPIDAALGNISTLTKAIAKNKQYLLNTGGLGYAEKIARYSAELDAIEALAEATEWSGTFDAALDRFNAALRAKQLALGVEVQTDTFSGHAFSRAENIELARSIGVLDELGGEGFFGALVPGASQ